MNVSIQTNSIIPKHFLLIIFFCLQYGIGSAQIDTISFYNTLNNCTNISAKEYPVQIARILPERAGKLSSFILYTVLILGHEGGNNFPSLIKPLTESILVTKTKVGLEAIEIQIQQPILINNNQFYIALDKFNGNFGLKQDATLAWGDIDNDNWLDLLVGSNLYKNKQGTFQNRSKKLDEYDKRFNRTMSFIDMDNDGDLDLLFLGQKKSTLNVNDGKGNFTSKELQLPPLPSLSAYSIADINKDKYIQI